MAVPVLYPNTPSPGHISWSAFNIQYYGLSYSIPASSTNKKFTAWIYNNGSPSLNFYDIVPDGQLPGNGLPNSTFAQTSEPTASNPLSNPGFEIDLAGWSTEADTSMTRVTTPVYDGVASALVTHTTTGPGVSAYRTISGLTVGQLYTVSAFVRVSNGANGVGMNVNGTTQVYGFAKSGSWTKISTTWVATAASQTLYVYNAIAAGTGSTTAGDAFWLDGVRLDPGASPMPDGWTRHGWATESSPDYRSYVGKKDGYPCVILDRQAADNGVSFRLNTPVAVSPGQQLYMQVEAAADTAGSAGIYIRYLDQNGTERNATTGGENQACTVAWKTYNATFTVPAGVTSIRPFMLVYQDAPATKVYVRKFAASASPPNPVLADDDLLLFLNKTGTPVNAQAASVVDGSLIVSQSILADALGANSVTAQAILAGSIDATKIAADTITANQIAAGAITTVELAAGAVTASKLTIGSAGDNEVPNGGFEGLDTAGLIDAWTAQGTGSAGVTGTTYSGARAISLATAASGAEQLDSSVYIPVVAGQQKYASIRAALTAGAPSLYYRVFFYDATKTALAGGLGSAYIDVLGGIGVTGSYVEYGGAFTVPALAKYAKITIYNTGASSTLLIDDVNLQTVVISAIIADGAINANKLAANSVTATAILAGTIDATRILADTITANQIAANAITASEIAANSIYTAALQAGCVTADRLSATSIDGKTITGAVLQTAASGERIVVRNDGSGGIIESYSGLSGETPGYFDPAAFGGLPSIAIGSGVTAALPLSATLRLYSGGSAGASAPSAAQLAGRQVQIQGIFGAANSTITVNGPYAGYADVDINGSDVQIGKSNGSGTVTIRSVLAATMAAGSVGVGTFRDSVDGRVTAINNTGGWLSINAFGGAAPAFSNAGYTTGASPRVAQYGKQNSSIAFLRGNVNCAIAAGASATLFTLPVGYRPTAQQIFFMDCSPVTTTARIVINTDGTVVVTNRGTVAMTVTTLDCNYSLL